MSPAPLALWTIGWPEILVILAVMLVVFGHRLPETMRNLGRSLNEFKRGMREATEELAGEIEPKPQPPADKTGPGGPAR